MRAEVIKQMMGFSYMTDPPCDECLFNDICKTGQSCTAFYKYYKWGRGWTLSDMSPNKNSYIRQFERDL